MEMKQQALAYARRGWAIVPVDTGTKETMVKWEDHQKVRPSEEQINAWWTKWPNANIGVITGPISGIVVADVDPRKGGNAREQFGISGTGLVSDTGGGGHHLFYQYPDGAEIGNSVGRTNGIDVRATGGIIVLPPSIHESGRRYRWRTEGELGVWKGVPPERVQEQEPESEQNKWITEALRGLKEGEGRDNLGAKLAGYFAAKQIPKDIARGFLEIWNRKNIPPMDDHDLVRITDSVYAGAKTRGATLPTAFTATPFNEFMQKWGSNEEKWLVKNWLPEATILLAVAPPGSYKTWLLDDLVVSLATGLPFADDFPVERSGPVLVVQQEDPHTNIAQRLSLVLWSKYGLAVKHTILDDGDEEFEVPAIPNIPLYIHEHRQLHFDDPNSMSAFALLVDQLKPILVVIDPLYSAASTEEFMAKAAGSMMLLKTLRDRHGTTFAIAHHTTKKGNGNGNGDHDNKIEREDAWGSQFLNAFLESGWQMRESEYPNTVLIKRHFKISGDLPDLVLEFDINTVGEDQIYDVTTQVKNTTEDKTPIAARLLAVIEQGPTTSKAISEQTNIPLSEIKRILKRMSDDDIIIQRGNVWEITEPIPL